MPVGSRGEGRLDFDSGTGRGRIDTWTDAVPVIGRKPLLGWGLEGFRTGFARDVSAEWVRTYGLDQIPDRAHNRFLDVAAASGAIGLIVDVALLAGVVSVARRSLRASTRYSEAWWARAGIAAASYRLGGAGPVPVRHLRPVDRGVGAGRVTGRVTGRVRRGCRDRRVRWRDPPVRWSAALLAVAVMAFAVVNVRADRTVASASGKPARTAIDRLDRAARARFRAT